MKKRQLFCMTLLGMATLIGCTDTKYVTSKATLDRTINEIKSDMAQKGYAPSGSSTDTKNNVYVEGTSYSKYSGYGSKMANDFVTTDTYRFTNEQGKTMNFSVSYKANEDATKGLLYVTDVQTAGCETTDAKQYDALCGSTSSVAKINNLPQDSSIEVLNVGKTTGLTVVLSLIGGVLVGLLLL